MDVRIVLAGRVGLEVDGEAVPDPGLGSLGRLTLAFLVVERHRPVSSDELAEVLWGDSVPPSWRSALRGLVSRVRELLSSGGVDRAGAVASGSGWYQLNLPTGAVVDVEAAAASLASAGEAMARHRGEDAVRAASEAVAVASRPFVVGARGAWVERRQREQRELHQRALETLARAQVMVGSIDEAVSVAEAAVALEPLRESAHLCLMAAHAAGGNRAAALRAYEGCRRLLAEELGVRPSEQTEAAYVRLLGTEPGPQAVPAADRAKPDEAGTSLPLALTALVGRERELDEVGRLLRTTRLLTVTGSGGVGKSRLALEVARTHDADAVAGTTVLVELASLAVDAEAERVAERVADAVGLRPDDGDVVRRLVVHLVPRRVLVVLDNCEHVVSATSTLAESLLRSCPGLRILATSQVPMRVPGETVWTLSPLEVPPAQASTLAEACRHAAARLLVERIADRCPDSPLTDADTAAVVEISRRLDGLPLALELAAARMGALSLGEIAALLDDRFRLLAGGARTAPARHRSLTATLEWAWDALDVRHRRLLRRLSVFAGSFTIDAASRIAASSAPDGSTIDLLADLVERCLVQVDPAAGASRYRLLESVRHFAGQRLEEAGEAGATRRRHLARAVALAEEAALALEGPDQRRWLDRLSAERADLIGALAWATSGPAPDDGLRLAAALGRFWEVRGHVGEGRTWLARALACATPGSDAVRGRACIAAATLAQRQGDLAAARSRHEEALALARTGGDLAAEAAALHGLGLLDAIAGDASGARSRYLNSLAIGRQLGTPSTVATALANLGWLSYNRADLPAARSMLEESLRIQRAEGLAYGAAWSWYFLGRLAESEGDLHRSRACHAEGLALRREIDDRSGVADSLAALGSVALHQEERAAAREWAEESLAVRRELGDRSGALESLRLLGDVARLTGEAATAEGCYRQSLALAEELDDRCCASRARVRLALLAGASDRHQQARALLHQAAPPGDPPDAVLAEWVEGVGLFAVDGGEAEVGARLLGAAAALRCSIGVPIPVAERAGYDEHLARARRALGNQAWAAATAAGQSMALEEALGCSRAQVAP